MAADDNPLECRSQTAEQEHRPRRKALSLGRPQECGVATAAVESRRPGGSACSELAERFELARRNGAGALRTRLPYDLGHSFASLLLAEGKQPIWCAKQLGHTVAVFLSTYAHLIDEFEDRERIDADAEIARARREVGTRLVRTTPG